MSPSDIAILIIGLAAVAFWFAWWRSRRIDRLHRRIDASRAQLDIQLVRRAASAQELAVSGLLDPASSLVLAEAAATVLALGGARGESDTRWDAESELSRTLRAALGSPEDIARLAEDAVGGQILDALAASWYRVEVARRFHNTAVAEALRLRAKPMARWLRLAGRAPAPQTVEMDDVRPDGLDPAGEWRDE